MLAGRDGLDEGLLPTRRKSLPLIELTPQVALPFSRGLRELPSAMHFAVRKGPPEPSNRAARATLQPSGGWRAQNGRGQGPADGSRYATPFAALRDVPHHRLFGEVGCPLFTPRLPPCCSDILVECACSDDRLTKTLLHFFSLTILDARIEFRFFQLVQHRIEVLAFDRAIRRI